MSPQLAQIEHTVDAPKRMIGRNVVLKAEVVEQPIRRWLASHHRSAPEKANSTETNHAAISTSTDFINSIGQKQTSAASNAMSALNGEPDITISF
jgi:hypothetical protein